jgi:tRNA 2-selenouridine synthase
MLFSTINPHQLKPIPKIQYSIQLLKQQLLLLQSHNNNNVIVLDVRTPNEYQVDHFPKSINTPVLSNEERILVGTLFKTNKEKAKGIGASLVLRRIANLIEQYEWLMKPNRETEFLIYCARGGLRSESLSTVLSGIGHQVSILEHGYKGYRHLIQNILQSSNNNSNLLLDNSLQFISITGLTGSGKTRYLRQLKANGKQIIDLEHLACHRGSIFGGFSNQQQPSQKKFESLLAWEMIQLDSTRGPVYVEAESQQIGEVTIPQPIMERMILNPNGGVIKLQATSMKERIQGIMDDYQDLLLLPTQQQQQEGADETNDNKSTIISTNIVQERLNSLLQITRDKKLIEELTVLYQSRKIEEFIQILLERHYDVKYKQSKVTRTLMEYMENYPERSIELNGFGFFCGTTTTTTTTTTTR